MIACEVQHLDSFDGVESGVWSPKIDDTNIRSTLVTVQMFRGNKYGRTVTLCETGNFGRLEKGMYWS